MRIKCYFSNGDVGATKVNRDQDRSFIHYEELIEDKKSHKFIHLKEAF